MEGRRGKGGWMNEWKEGEGEGRMEGKRVREKEYWGGERGGSVRREVKGAGS